MFVNEFLLPLSIMKNGHSDIDKVCNLTSKEEIYLRCFHVEPMLFDLLICPTVKDFIGRMNMTIFDFPISLIDNEFSFHPSMNQTDNIFDNNLDFGRYVVSYQYLKYLLHIVIF